MDKSKTATFPDLMETMNRVVTAHQAIHTAIAHHVEGHATGLANRRQQLSVKREADRLMKTEEPK